jgi:hypothetical protein
METTDPRPQKIKHSFQSWTIPLQLEYHQILRRTRAYLRTDNNS